MGIKEIIDNGETWLGIELGSTRIKAVLIGSDSRPIASGSHEWENQYIDNIWTYHLDDILNGLQECYTDLTKDVAKQYQTQLKRIGAIGISAMMHGYMAFDKNNELLVPFRTWRNTITEEAAAKLTGEFAYNIPQRWSIAHLYQAILNQETHVKDLSYMTTLSGYIHWRLTGEKVLGIGDASGMFPIDSNTRQFDARMVEKFDELVQPCGYSWKLLDVMPKVLTAGDAAGTLSAAGAKLLDVSGTLQPGISLCPPEGDAGTGMTATNSVALRTGNVSAGTSIFAMVVLEKELSKVHQEIDLVTTPSGEPVAMAHCNNCTSDLNAWVNLFGEFAESFGIEADKTKLFETLYQQAMKGDPDCGGLLSYNYFSGEGITEFEEGRPLFVRSPKSNFTLANFMRAHLFSALATLKIGMDILLQEEHIKVDEMIGHGGLFKTKGVGQKIMAAAMDAPISVMETAGEGGAWGIAVLAAYMQKKEDNETLAQYLDNKIFAGWKKSTEVPDLEDVAGFEAFMERYSAGLGIERAAVDSYK